MMLCRSDDVSPLPIGWALGIYLNRAVEYPVFVHRSHAGSTITSFKFLLQCKLDVNAHNRFKIEQLRSYARSNFGSRH